MSEPRGIYWRPSRARGAWVAVLAWMLVIVALSAAPVGGPRWVRVPLGLDKWLHAAFYTVLAILGSVAWRSVGSGPGVAAVRAAALAVAYGGLVEWMQSFLPREPSFADWAADVVGGVAGAGGWWLVKGRPDGTEAQ